MKKSNVFKSGTYDTCIVESCNNRTQHKSGQCTQCRTKACLNCGRVITLMKAFNKTKPICGMCLSKRKSE